MRSPDPRGRSRSPAYKIEKYSPRSPQDRSWGTRDRDDRHRSNDRSDRDRDSFYRGRSPGVDRSRRARERSRSPDRDRYEDRGREYGRRERDGRDGRDSRDDRSGRDRERRPSPSVPNIDRYVPGQEPAVPMVNAVQSPHTMPFQVGFSYFGEWWRANEKIKEERERMKTGKRPREKDDQFTEKAKIQAAYDTYRVELQARMARTFVQEHKGEQWFQERYLPEVRDPIRQQLSEFRRGNYSQWEQDLESGTFDEFSLEGIPKNESNGIGGVIEKEEGETTAVNEVLGVGDLIPSRGSDIRDENAFQPTLLIKTIAPHVNRTNIEAFCKEHLGEGEGGFKWLSLSDPNPSKRYHRIGWVMLHPAPETAATFDRPDTMDEDGEAPAVPAAPQSTADKALDAINGKQVTDEVRGNFTCHVGVHVPPALPRKKALWDLFSAPERIERDLELAQRLVKKYEEDFGSDFNAVQKIEERAEELRSQGLLVPAVTASTTKKAKKQRDYDNLDEEMDEGEEAEEGEEEEEGALDEEVDDEDLLVKKKQLDLLVEYLRRVFNFCFFCVFEADSIHELIRKCPGGHLRRPRTTLSTASKAAARASAAGEPLPGKTRRDSMDDGEIDGGPEKKFQRGNNASKTEQQLTRAFNWVKTFEEKILQILEPENVDVHKLGGKDAEEAVQEEITKFVKQEDEHKYRCRVPECQKLFKEEHFWRKHIEKRHPEWYESLKKDFELVNTYVLDPSHIAPSRSDANSNGHFPPANGHVPAGTPRGYNVQSYGILGNGMNPMGIPGFGTMFNGMQNGMAFNGRDGNAAGGGPMRRGGRGAYGNNNRPGPYDRNNSGGVRRWGADTGRLSPPGGNRRPGAVPGANRWGDGAAGGAAVGPREAVQGRSLKSYEDLDAVAGNGAGELPY